MGGGITSISAPSRSWQNGLLRGRMRESRGDRCPLLHLRRNVMYVRTHDCVVGSDSRLLGRGGVAC